MNIAIRVDVSLRIGTGHFARCLTLANTLKRGGGNILFVSRHMTEFMRAQIREAGHEFILLQQRNELPDGDLAHSAWLGVPQALDASDTLLALKTHSRIEWLIVDHYALDARWERALRATGARLLALDDLADRPHDVDALLDQNLQSATQDRYANLLPPSCRRLIGPRFALLRPEFRTLVAASPSERNRLNIFFGGMDPDGMTIRAIEALDTFALRDLPTDIVIGIDNPHRDRIATLVKKLPRTQLHIQPTNMGALMNKAWLALGAGGATSWERCCLGIPTAIVSIAENQRSGCRALARERAAFYLGDMGQITADKIGKAIQNLLRKPHLLAAVSRRAAALVDGRGAERVAVYMRRANVSLRLAETDDALAKWQWRNDPRTRRYSNNPSTIRLPDHLAWWKKTLCDPSQVLLIAQCGGGDVGVLRFDIHNDAASVSIYLDPDMINLGLGQRILHTGAAWLAAHRPEVRKIVAEIRPDNATSIGSFVSAGFSKRTERQWARGVP